MRENEDDPELRKLGDDPPWKPYACPFCGSNYFTWLNVEQVQRAPERSRAYRETYPELFLAAAS